MAQFDFTSPQGQTYSITGPDGSTPEQAFAVLQQHLGTPSTPAAPTTGGTGTVNAFTGGAIEGVPVVGPLIKGGAERAAAGIRSLMHGTPYADELNAVQSYAGKAAAEHPIANTTGQIAGAIGSTGAAATTTLGARLLGMTGATLPARMAAGAASGTVMNAADAAVRGEDPLAGGTIGGVLGAGFPLAGRVAGALAQPVVNTIRGAINPAEQATRNVAGAISRDVTAGAAGMTDPQFTAAMQAGQPATVMDLGGETTRALARSAANTSPEGRQVLNRAIDDRFSTQSGRLNDWLASTFNFPDADAQRRALTQVQRTTNQANYRTAMQEGANGIWSPDLERLAGSDAVGNAMKSAASTYRDEAIVSGGGAMNPRVSFTPDGRMQFATGPSGTPVYPDLQFWDLTRRQLSDQASAAFRAGRASEGRRLSNFADALNNELDTQAPSYATARGTASTFFGAHDALDAGERFVTARMDNDGARQALAQMSPLEQQLFQDGFVSRFMAQIRESPDRQNIVRQIANSPAAVERLNIALGPQRASQLQAMLHIENIMDQARGAIQGNSTTARQLFELGLAGGAYGAASAGDLMNPDPSAIMSAALTYGLARGRGAINTRVSRQVAELLASNDVNRVRTGMRLIAQNPAMVGGLHNFDQALARTAAEQLTPGPSPQVLH